MPYNGSGTFVLAESPFVPGTPISSSAVNSDFQDIAQGLSTAVTKDGQTVITAPFKGENGSVGLPMYSFNADQDCGMYRIGANNIGFSANGTKIFEISTAGLGISIASVAVDGAVGAPVYTFASDTDTGIYRIGANNIGVAANGAKVLDISTSGLNVIGTVSSNGAAFAPIPQAVGMVNGTITATPNSPGASAITFAIKTLAGTDPSATDIVYFVFRNATAATGNYTVLQVTAALSLTVTNGSLLGTANSVPFKLWLVAFNDSGTVRLGIINNVLGAATPTSIYPLGQFPMATPQAEGGAGGADSAQVFYWGTATAGGALPYIPLGYMAYESGIGTAGAWTASPTRIQLYGTGVPLPGHIVQTATALTTSNTTTVTGSYVATASTVSITPTSAANLVNVRAFGSIGQNGSTDAGVIQLRRGTSTAFGPEIAMKNDNNAAGYSPGAIEGWDAPGVTTSTAYTVYLKSSGTTNTAQYPQNTFGAQITAQEVMA